MAIIEGEFVQHQPTWDYAAFRAEFLRRKRQTSYERVNEGAECERERKAAALAAECPPTADGVPYWADYQIAPGIRSTIHLWQSERFQDPDHEETKIRYTHGILEMVRHPIVEPFALDALESEALTWQRIGGRITLTPDEHRILQLSRRYMTNCDTFAFRAKNSGYEPIYRRDGTLVEAVMHRWISKITGFSVKFIEGVLLTCEHIYKLRANLGMDTEAPVRVGIAATKVAPIAVNTDGEMTAAA